MTRDEATKEIRESMDNGYVKPCLDVMAHEMAGEEYNSQFLRGLADHLRTWYCDEPGNDVYGSVCKCALETLAYMCEHTASILE